MCVGLVRYCTNQYDFEHSRCSLWLNFAGKNDSNHEAYRTCASGRRAAGSHGLGRKDGEDGWAGGSARPRQGAYVCVAARRQCQYGSRRGALPRRALRLQGDGERGLCVDALPQRVGLCRHSGGLHPACGQPRPARRRRGGGLAHGEAPSRRVGHKAWRGGHIRILGRRPTCPRART